MGTALSRNPTAAKKSPPRDARDMEKYKAAQENIKKYAQDSPQFIAAANRLQTIGNKYGLNYQQWIPKQSNGQGTQPPVNDQTVNDQKEDALVNEIGGDLYQRMGGFAEEFDPNTFQQKYDPQFNQQMDRAYNAVYDQFERRNKAEFARQNEDFQQMAAERGLDPNGEAYKGLAKQLGERQDFARQEAQNAAVQQSYNVNQQGYDQATGASLIGGQIFNQFAAPYMAQYATRATTQVNAQQQEYNKELAALDFKYKTKLQKSAPRGGGGGGGAAPNYLDQYLLNQTMQNYAPQGQQPNPTNSAIQGVVAGTGQAAINYWGQPTKTS